MDLHSNLFHSRKEKSKRGIASAGSLIAHAILLVTFITLSATTVSNISAEKPMRAFIAHAFESSKNGFERLRKLHQPHIVKFCANRQMI